MTTRWPVMALTLLTLAACGEKDTPTDDSAGEVDADGDGFAEDVDCDDNAVSVYPGAAEACDGVDNNCDGTIDEGVTTSVWADGDGDGFGDASAPSEVCEVSAGYATTSSDCDDTDAGVYPGASEVCDGVDNDCDGLTDDDDDSLDTSSSSNWYGDDDGDGFGADDAASRSCEAPAGSVADGGDCDDADPYSFPGADELCDGYDNDCDGDDSDDGQLTFFGVDGPEDFTYLLSESAVTPLQIVGEGALRFCDGTYLVSVEATASASVESLNGAEATTLDAGGEGPVIYTFADGVDLELNDLTLTGGAGAVTELTPDNTAGGGLLCESDGTTTLTLADVAITENGSEYGGGVFTFGCDLTMIRSDVSGNVGDYVGGLYLVDGLHLISESTINDNASLVNVGGLYALGYSDFIDLTLDEVHVEGNDGAAAAAGVAGANSYITWYGTTSSASGTTSNTLDEGGVAGGLYLENSAFTGSVVDFGDTASDNDHSDVFVGDIAFSYRAGDDATFDCDPAGCGTAADYALSADATSNEYSRIIKGNIFEAETNATINEFAVRLSPESSCVVDFYVVSDVDVDDDWEVVWSSADNVFTTDDLHSSGPIGVAVEEGRYYGLVVGVYCSDSADGVLYYYDSGYAPSALDGGFGSSVARFDDINDYSGLQEETFEGDVWENADLRYDMTVSVTEL